MFRETPDRLGRLHGILDEQEKTGARAKMVPLKRIAAQQCNSAIREDALGWMTDASAR
jgi:hypothetical protein